MDNDDLFLIHRNLEEILRLEVAFQHGTIDPDKFSAIVGELARKSLYLLTGE